MQFDSEMKMKQPCKTIKPQPNDCNLSMQQYHNTVGCNSLLAFCHPVAMCCDMLGVVGSSLKMLKFETTCHRTSQKDGKMEMTYCAQQSCNTLGRNVAIIGAGL